MTLYAYVRVSKDDCEIQNQLSEMYGYGMRWDEVASDEGVSGSIMALERPGWAAMASKLRKGDKVHITKIDRLGRSAADVLTTIDWLKVRGIGLVVKQFDGVDLTSSIGKMLVAMLAAAAEFERDLISERTKAGLVRARQEGKVLGKPAADGKKEHVLELLKQGIPITEIARITEISRPTIYKWRDESVTV